MGPLPNFCLNGHGGHTGMKGSFAGSRVPFFYMSCLGNLAQIFIEANLQNPDMIYAFCRAALF